MTGRELIQWIVLNEAMDLEVFVQDDYRVCTPSPHITQVHSGKSYYYEDESKQGQTAVVM